MLLYADASTHRAAAAKRAAAKTMLLLKECYRTGERKEIREMTFARGNLSSGEISKKYQYKVDNSVTSFSSIDLPVRHQHRASAAKRLCCC